MPSKQKEGENEKKPSFEVESSTTMSSSRPEVGKLNLKEESEVIEKEMNEVGKLNPKVDSEVVEKETNEVGKPSPREGGDVAEKEQVKAAEVDKLNLKEESKVVEKEMNEVGKPSPWEGGDVIEEIFEETFGGVQQNKDLTVEESIQQEGENGNFILDEGGIEDDLLVGEQVDEESPPLDGKHAACIEGGPELIDEQEPMLDIHPEDDELKSDEYKGELAKPYALVSDHPLPNKFLLDQYRMDKR